MLPLVCGWDYFPKNKGVVTGIFLGSYGFSSFLFNPLLTYLINPDNEKAEVKITDDLSFFGPEIANRVPGTIRLLVMIWAGLIFFSMLLITRPPAPAEDEAEERL